jgi:uncharacterized protein (DUF433 family)
LALHGFARLNGVPWNERFLVESEMADPIQRDPEVLGGTPTFRGTRVPVRTLFQYLEAGDSLALFLEDFPSVSEPEVIEVLELASKRLLGDEAAA